MLRQLRNPKLYLMLLGDALLIAAALALAYLLRFEFSIPAASFKQLYRSIGYIVLFKIAVFYVFGLYRGMWRYTSLKDFWQVAKACVFSSLIMVAVVTYLYRFQGFSRSVYILDSVLTFVFVGSLRVMIRSAMGIKSIRGSVVDACLPWRAKSRRDCRRVVLVGAGSAGEKILREIEENPQLQYFPVAFLDDDPGKIGRTLHGVPILGSVETLPRAVLDLNADQILITTPSATGEQVRRIVGYCEESDVPYKIMPGYGEILDGKVSIRALRDVNFNDLLGRPPVQLDVQDIRNYIAGRVVLVTGCGGSIGSELCRQLIRFDPASLILLDAGEANLYAIQMQLLHELGFSNIVPVLGRVQDRPLMAKIFAKYRPLVVYHAAAYKHVPMIEKNPWEAVFNNVLGSRITMEMALEHGVRRFVLVSTDKAVRPTNVMGASKRITELILQSINGGDTRFMAVRFGNVVGSSGSVIPLFRSQIEKGGPVTVTHPEVTRYFMTIPEASQLIIQAGGMGEGGEIFVLEMGTPVKILDMARDLIKLSGKEPDRDIQVVFTGLRAGEKLYEELITAGEDVVATHHKKIMVLRCNGLRPGLETQDELQNWLDGRLEILYAAAKRHDAAAIKQCLKEIVPEYKADDALSNLD
ncbi:polysaccharide biosynthesis protein [Desulfoferrobacter suflitae]|uniref:polysaccharide biosynthesis protein n=1 Tax=Desulfoferrobacter suflitae TaxID=2865782 RepID=UPI002164030E|nr:nucleoside-diphosphate sugar epimerase/dehydratase [Desulfoferrobacter suflitae]MCK8602279.1 polysaccharide biosynthesis protein [Desulfoferrobacter suflitae]